MKTALVLAVSINIFIFLAPVYGAHKTFKEIEDEAKMKPAEQALTVLKDPPRYFIEGCVLACIMSIEGPGKYHPFGGRTVAVLHAGRGSGNTITGVIGFLRLQLELITLHETNKEILPYTKVLVVISRDEHVHDEIKVPPKHGGETDQVKWDRLIKTLDVLKTLMESNGYTYVRFEEQSLSTQDSAADLQAELEKEFERFKGMVKPDEIAMSMDIVTGAGKRGQKTANKVFLNMMAIKYLADKNVPTFLHDGRSCAGNDNFSAYEFQSQDKVYGVHTGRVIAGEPVQGLIVTDITKTEVLVEYQPTTKDDKAILVGHGKVSAANIAFLESAMRDPINYMQNAFEVVVVENLGYYKIA